MSEQRTLSTNTKIVVLAIAALLVVVLVLSWRAPNTRVPESLLGEWHTAEAQHADRYFEITPVSLSFTTGEGVVYTGFIKDVQQIQEGSRTLYTIVYDVDGTRNELSFYFESANGSDFVIRFKNQQDMVWKKSETT
jgi:hypothetical protein